MRCEKESMKWISQSYSNLCLFHNFHLGLLSILPNSSRQNYGLHSKWMWEKGVETVWILCFMISQFEEHIQNMGGKITTNFTRNKAMEIFQGSIRLAKFGWIKQYKCMVILRDFPYNSAMKFGLLSFNTVIWSKIPRPTTWDGAKTL